MPLSLATSQELLQDKVAELYWKVLAEVQAKLVEEFARAFQEIDRAIDRALVVPQLRRGASSREVTAAVKQAAIVKEAVKEPLRQRLGELLAEDRRVAHARAERANRRVRTSAPLAEPVVTAVVSSGAPPASPAERKLVLLNKVTP